MPFLLNVVNMPLRSNIEQFVIAHIRKYKNTNQRRGERKFIEKALAQINFFLDRPCCEDPEASIEFARRDNDLTIYINAILKNNDFDRRKYKRSLLRTKRLLENFLNDPCCEVPSDGPIAPSE